MPNLPPTHRPQGWRSEAQRKAESDAHRRKDPAYKARRRLYNSKAWQVARREFLATHPYCEQCQSDGRLNVFAVHVDHKVAVARGGAPLEYENLRALCKSCHSRKTAQQDGGYGRPRAGGQP